MSGNLDIYFVVSFLWMTPMKIADFLFLFLIVIETRILEKWGRKVNLLRPFPSIKFQKASLTIHYK